MKRFTLTSFFAALAILLFAFAVPERKLEKLTSKVWTDESFQLEQLEVPDSLKAEMNDLYKVTSNEGQLLGYVCNTTAFGCKVGGCAAPSNPNVQSYETFEYIVIYDRDFRIKKIDISNYGGQYGYQICRSKWLEQFEGSTKDFELNENIDGISGATVSAQFLVDDLNDLGALLPSLGLEFLAVTSN